MKKKINFTYLKVIIGITFALIVLLAAAFLYSRSWENALFIKPIHRLNTTEKVIALTFDDGPSNARTPGLLKLLAKHNVPATFFMIGQNIEKHPDIAQQVLDAGHLIGNHSYDHPRMYFKPPWEVIDQIQRTDILIKKLGQQEVKYFRPPHSAKFIVVPLVLNYLNKSLVTGSYDPPAEYETPYIGRKVADEVISNIHPGAIIYLHDGNESQAEEFLLSVDYIITDLKRQGYSFAALDGRKEPDVAKYRNAIETKYPEFKDFENQSSFAGKSVEHRIEGRDFYFTYILHGSGVPVVKADCFKVDQQLKVTRCED